MRTLDGIRRMALGGTILAAGLLAAMPAMADEAAPASASAGTAETGLPEAIMGYRVVQPTKADLGTLGDDLSRFINVSAVKLGPFSEEVLNLEVYVQFLKDSPVLGTVHMIEFRKLSLNGIRFEIEGFKDIKIPKEGPYESDEPVRIRARYADVDLGALRTFLSEDLRFQVEGQVWTFGKFKVGKKKGKFCIPVAISVDVPAQDLTGNDRYEEVASVIRALVKANIVGNLGEAIKQVEAEAGGGAPAEGAEPAEGGGPDAPPDGGATPSP